MRSIPSLILLACVAANPLRVSAAEKNDPAAVLRYRAIAAATSLDAPGLRPWHAKLEVTFFDKDGKNPKVGSLEVWSDGATNMRSIAILDDRKITSLRNGDKLFRTAADATDFAGFDLVLDQLLHPLPDELASPTAIFKRASMTVSKTKLDCITAYEPIDEDKNLAPTPTRICVPDGTDTVELSNLPTSLVIWRSRSGVFQGKTVFVELEMNRGTTLRLKAKTVALGIYNPQDAEFVPPPDLPILIDPVPMAADALRYAISVPGPRYPFEARLSHTSGAVNFDVLIGTTGHVSALTPLENPNLFLAEAAKTAIERWTYRPHRVNGVPVKVHTKITMNFNLGPG